MSAYEEKIGLFTNEGVALYDKILVGLQFEAVTKGKAALKSRLQEQGRYKAIENEKRIQTYLQEKTSNIYSGYKQSVDAIKLPIPRKELAESVLSKLTTEVEQQLGVLTGDYTDTGAQVAKTRLLECKSYASACESKNGQLLDRITQEAMSIGQTRYSSVMETLLTSRGDNCVIDQALAAGDADATKQGMAAFEAGLGVAANEDKTPKFRSDTQSALQGLLTSFQTRNNRCVQHLAEKARKRAVDEAHRSFSQMQLPMAESALQTAISQQERQRNNEYDEQMTAFQSSASVSNERTKLSEEFLKEAGRFRHENVKAVKRVVRDPLLDTEEEQGRHVLQYWTTWSFEKDCRQIALKRIKRNGALSKELDAFVGEVIEEWLSNDMSRYTAQLERRTRAVIITPIAIIGVAWFKFSFIDRGGLPHYHV